MLPKVPQELATLTWHKQAFPESAAQRAEVRNLSRHGRNRTQRMGVMARAGAASTLKDKNV